MLDDDGYDGADIPATKIVDDARFRRFMELRIKRDEAKVTFDKAESEYRQEEQALYDDLMMSPIKGAITVDLGGDLGTVRFTRRETYYAKVIDPDRLLDYLNGRALTEEATETKFSRKRLNELVNEALENHQNPPPGLDWSPSRGITVTRSK